MLLGHSPEEAPLRTQRTNQKPCAQATFGQSGFIQMGSDKCVLDLWTVKFLVGLNTVCPSVTGGMVFCLCTFMSPFPAFSFSFGVSQCVVQSIMHITTAFLLLEMMAVYFFSPLSLKHSQFLPQIESNLSMEERSHHSSHSRRIWKPSVKHSLNEMSTEPESFDAR